MNGRENVRARGWLVGVLVLAAPAAALFQATAAAGLRTQEPAAVTIDNGAPPTLRDQDEDGAWAKSAGCVKCHQNVGDPHGKETLHLGCCDCHGGNPAAETKEAAHVASRHPEIWCSSANPVRSYTLLNHEAPEFIRFVNPGDLRVAHISCGTANCHPSEVLQNRKSMMTHGCMLWGAALYNNGAVPFKRARYGESYSMNGVPQRIQTVPPPTQEEIEKKGVVPYLDPLPRFEITQPGNILRIFERGGRFRPDVGIPNRMEDPGRPFLSRLSVRGLGTENRTDPVFVGLQKTRLLDPTLNFLGTNDNPGDYRSSGCTACHFVYANDRSRVHSGPYARFGNRGTTATGDPTIPRDEPGHPIEHRFAKGNSIPTSQCMTCHMHPGTNVMNSYLGFMWWDEETDGAFIYPEKQVYPTAEEAGQVQQRNPNESAIRSKLADPEFVARMADLNPQLKHTQFADFHGHGWAFRAVFKQDRHGELLDYRGKPVGDLTPDKLQAAMRFQQQAPKDRKPMEGVPVHQMDIHLEKGMHCIDCHFIQDNHGNTRLQQEVRAAIEITCIDCHGTVNERATLRTTGPAAYTSSPQGGRDLLPLRTPFGRRRFEKVGNKVYQNSMVEKDLRWEVPQVADVIDPQSERYNQKAALAKTVRVDDQGRMVWGKLPGKGEPPCAHANDNMSCIACHSAWNPSCFGCHLPQKANKKLPMLHADGDVTRNYVSYNFQTLREDVFMLARDGDVTGNRINPARSSCAIHVGSYNQNRESIYVQQQTISAEGFSGIAFSTNVPHTVRGGPPRGPDGRALFPEAYLPGRNDTKQCTDCHVAKNNDNNAILAQLLMHGTNYVNFIGKYCWVAAGEEGFYAVTVTTQEEPQAVIGSHLHQLAFPDDYRKHCARGGRLEVAHEHPGHDVSDALHPHRKDEILAVQARGEYLYAACGEGGLRVFDISFVDHKGFSERIFTAPVSPAGQRFYVPTKYATSVAAPTTIAPDPTRVHFKENKEGSVHAIYGELFVTDKYEGLILVGAGTLLDGDPLNNFLERDLTFNPNGLLNGAKSVTIIGVYAYVCCDAGLVVIDFNDPKKPVVKAILGEHEHLKHPEAVQAQFRYAYVCDEEGVKVLDVTDPAKPKAVSHLELEHAHNIYLARTYAYVAAGEQGLVILNIENPLMPEIDQVYNAGGCINDLHDVKLGITYASEFAYLADGRNGLRVLQLTSQDTPGYTGFSPRPTPRLIATYKIPKGGHALAISKGVDRDRAVDESGNQLAVFGRVGARPLNLEEQRKMYLRNGRVWTVSDDPQDPLYHWIRPGRPGPAR